MNPPVSEQNPLFLKRYRAIRITYTVCPPQKGTCMYAKLIMYLLLESSYYYLP